LADKVKVCPNCGAINKELAYMCVNKECLGSLMYVNAEEKPSKNWDSHPEAILDASAESPFTDDRS